MVINLVGHTIYTFNKSFIVSQQYVRAFRIGPAFLYPSEWLPLSLLQEGHASSSMVMDSWVHMVTLRIYNGMILDSWDCYNYKSQII